jgi:HAD superfamily hydrolase (TIGR01450 family)
MKSKNLSDSHDVFLLDLDGVVYRGGAAVAGAVETISRLEAQEKRVGYVTNNSSRRPETVAEQLVGYGLHVKPEQVVGSAVVAVEILRAKVSPPARVLVVGGDGLRHATETAGYLLVESAAESPTAVIQGFSPEVGWKHLAEASFAIQNGAVWIATNQDWTLPLEQGLAPGNGTLVSAVHTAVGQLPTFAGKPAAPIFEAAKKQFAAARPLFVGDRLDTDSKGARAVGMESAIVLTGVCTRKDLLAARPEEQPEWILETLADLYATDLKPQKTKFGYSAGGASVELHGNVLRVVEGDPKSIGALRAACATIWASGKTVHMLDVDMRLI